jgi:site-specific DNA-methyltransferase (adenine-specific)
MGSGQTAIAAIRTKRHFVGYDISQEYVQLAERRIVTVQR